MGCGVTQVQLLPTCQLSPSQFWDRDFFDVVVPPWRRRGWWTETKWDAYEFKCSGRRICHVGGRGRERLDVVKSTVKRRQVPTACIFITAFIKVIVRYTPSRIMGTFRPRTMRFILGVVLLEFPSEVSECGFRSSAFRPFPQPPSEHILCPAFSKTLRELMLKALYGREGRHFTTLVQILFPRNARVVKEPIVEPTQWKNRRNV